MAPPVSILKRPQSTAVLTPPAKAVAKDIPPHLPAAKATTAPHPAQEKASGLPTTILVTQTPVIPKPLKGGVKEIGSHITTPAVGADAKLEPTKGRVNHKDSEFPALPTRKPLMEKEKVRKAEKQHRNQYNIMLTKQMAGPPESTPPSPPKPKKSEPQTGDDGFI